MMGESSGTASPSTTEGEALFSVDLPTVGGFRVERPPSKEQLMYEFEVQSMTCGHCASRVTQALKNLDTTAKVEIDLAAKKVRVQTVEDRGSVVAALADAGYAPQ
jgi:copper chaperone